MLKGDSELSSAMKRIIREVSVMFVAIPFDCPKHIIAPHIDYLLNKKR